MFPGITQHAYRNIIRWDLISMFSSITKSRQVPSFYNGIEIRLHESKPKHYRDRFILALFLELVTNQRVSPTIIDKGTYYKSLVVKKSNKSAQARVTLRRQHVDNFMDRWIYVAMPKARHFKGISNFKSDKRAGTVCFYEDIFSFPELHNMNSFITSCNGIQIFTKPGRHHIMNPETTLYLFSAYRIPRLTNDVESLDIDIQNMCFLNNTKKRNKEVFVYNKLG